MTRPSFRMGTRGVIRGWAVLAWIAAVAAGFYFLTGYELKPGAAAAPPATWPGAVPVAFDPHRMNLVLFAHPECPCTSATLAELVKIMTRCGDRVTVSILFLSSASEPGWNGSSLWHSASRIPGLAVLDDPEGKIAARFGAHTSGQALLFDPAGRLLFSGGITGSRGHEGDNPGADAVTDAVREHRPSLTQTPTYGCSLLGMNPPTPTIP